MYSLNAHKSRQLILMATVLAIIVSIATYDATLLALGLLLLLVFLLFIKNPELPLAILFNGTLIYLYTVYKLGSQTNTALTGLFYAFLGYSFLLAEMLLLTRKQVTFRVSVVDVLFLLFFFLFFLSYFAFPTNNDYAYKKLTYAPFLAIIPYFGGRFLFSEKRIKNFCKYSVLVAVLLMVPAFYELFFTSLPSQRVRFSMFYFTGATAPENPILFGKTFAIPILIIFVMMFENRKYYLKNLALIAIFGYFVFLSGSRGVIVSLAIAGSFYLFIVSKTPLKTKLSVIFALLVLFGISYMAVPENISDFYKYSISKAAFQDTTSSFHMRIIVWKQAICDFIENPFFGIGMGNFNSSSPFPHNIILEVAAEFGVLGLFVFISLCYTTVRKATVFLKNKQLSNSHTLMRLLLVLFIYFLTHAMISGHIANHSPLYISMGLIVCLDNLWRLRLPARSVNSSVKNSDNFTKEELDVYNCEYC